ncbi:Hypothetical predicted protein [Octopus vulgaris]|uniref:Uncharacterized protein n=1 Tax=Octopus vulgaris TaxID=6645 RepID=A0AA36B5D9_OCTVU|nr:Hypothetical predicted protein [Octopus vulgaris]
MKTGHELEHLANRIALISTKLKRLFKSALLKLGSPVHSLLILVILMLLTIERVDLMSHILVSAVVVQQEIHKRNKLKDKWKQNIRHTIFGMSPIELLHKFDKSKQML